MLSRNKNNQFYLKSSFKTAPNIGIIKYWGKWNEEEIIPLNDNIGITLNEDDIFTITKIKFTSKVNKHTLILNGKEANITKRIQR